MKLRASALSVLFPLLAFMVLVPGDGDLDGPYGTNGIVITPIGSGQDFALAVAVQPDGMSVVCGTSFNGTNFDVAIARYDTEGDLDAGFNSGGTLTMAFGTFGDLGTAVLVYPDGKILIGAETTNSSTDFGIARFLSDGTPDGTFGGGDGEITINISGGSYDALRAMTVQPDGKIVAVGYTDNAIAVIRVDDTGVLDSGFGTGGIVTKSISTNGHHPRGVAIQNDDKIVVAGNFADSEEELDLFVLRLHPNGVPDSSFADDGVAIADQTAEEGYGVALQSDGKIVVGGNMDITSFYTTIAAFRFNTNGTLDSSFDGDGIAIADFGVASFGYSLALQADGKILIGGEVGDSDINVAVARFNSNGSLDNTFGGGDGMSVVTVTDSTSDRSTGIALQSDGNIVVAGYTYAPTQDFLVLRLIGSSGPLPVQMSSFTARAIGSSAELKWRTESEVENHGFEIERRRVTSSGLRVSDSNQHETPNTQHATEWVRAGFVTGAGTSSSPRDYSFVDKPDRPGRYAYRIKQIDHSGASTYTSTLEVELGLAPLEFTLSQNYPNPFNPSTTIEFTIPKNGHVTLKVYDLAGRQVATLVDGELAAGVYHQVVFDAGKLASGMYVAQLESKGKRMTKRMVLAK